MNSAHLKYLRNINKHVGGPLKSGAQDRNTTRALFAISGVLSRVIVNAENTSPRLDQLKASCKKWQPQLSRLMPTGTDAAREVDALVKLVDAATTTDVASPTNSALSVSR